MSMYQHLLLATDLTESNQAIAKKAAELASLFGAKLSIVHAIEYVPMVAAGYIPDVDFIEDLKKNAESSMAKLGEMLAVPTANQHVVVDKPRTAILETTKAQSVDLIVIGKRTHHGLERLLGSTANSLLHGCEDVDVMTLMVE